MMRGVFAPPWIAIKPENPAQVRTPDRPTVLQNGLFLVFPPV
jgi:hypothetical protein